MSGDHISRRIACLPPSATVILDAIGELDRVVAGKRYCADVVPGVSDGSRTILADPCTADSAGISVRPDLVIAAVPFQEKALAEILKHDSSGSLRKPWLISIPTSPRSLAQSESPAAEKK